MFDPDRPDPEEPEATWDEWFDQHHGGRNRWLLVFAVVMVAAMVGLYLSGNFWGTG